MMLFWFKKKKKKAVYLFQEEMKHLSASSFVTFSILYLVSQ